MGGGETPSESSDYGSLGSNLITIGSTRDITYTSCVLLGTVDFPKITGDHSYGIVYLEALQNPEFDYDRNLQYGGHSGKNDKESYDCVAAQVYNSTSDGKFEKQLVNLKPATTYYYRAYVRIGSNVNYSEVRNFVTKDPASEITMSTNDATDIYAVSAMMNGIVNVGNLQDVNEKQAYGFIYTDAEQMKTPETLTYEYYSNWSMNHFETEDEFDAPSEVIATSNLNGRINFEIKGLTPGKTYYYRSFFRWNDKYFYSPTVKAFNTLGSSEIHVGTYRATDVTSTSATLNASVPFSKIGLDYVKAVFMISSKYSNASEFIMDDLHPWEERNRYPNENVYYIETTINDTDYSMAISGLLPETTYYVRSAVKIGTYDDEDFWIYGTMQEFKTEPYTSEFITTSAYEKIKGVYNCTSDNGTLQLSIATYPKGTENYLKKARIFGWQGYDWAQIECDFTCDVTTGIVSLNIPEGALVAEDVNFGDDLGICKVFACGYSSSSGLSLGGNISVVSDADVNTFTFQNGIAGGIFDGNTTEATSSSFLGYIWFRYLSLNMTKIQQW